MERKRVYGNLSLSSVRENLGSNAFRIERRQNASEEEARDDLLSYLGEYRFKLPTYNYQLHFAEIDGKYHLRDKHKLEPMVVKAKKAVSNRNLRGLPVNREMAEERGLERLDEMLNFAGEDCNVFWASPPGPKEEGYGDYGFIFVGRIKQENKRDKLVDMTAIRVESPQISEFNRALSDVSGMDFKYTRAEEFLANPLVLRGVEERIKASLKNFTINNNPFVFERFKRDISRVNPLIDRFINAKTAEEKLVLFNTIENFITEPEAIKEEFFLKDLIAKGERMLNVSALVAVYGDKEAPRVQGSCGATGTETSNIFNNLGGIRASLNGENNLMKCVTCPFCHETVDAELTEDKITCPSCKESASR
jgi:hypothetical protein